MALDPAELKKILVEKGRITVDQFNSAEKTAKHVNVPVAEVIIGRHLLSEREIGELIANSLGVKYVDLKKIDIAPELLELIPQDMAIARRVIPFERDGNTLHVAMEEPTNLETLDFVRKKTELEVEPYFTTSNGIKYALRLYKRGIKEFIRTLQEITDISQPTAIGVEKLAHDVSVIRIVDTTLEYAVSEDASDIHIEGLVSGVLIRYRIDGILHDVITLPRALQPAIVARIKILSDLKLDETRMPQDGQFRFKTKEGEAVSLRVSILPTVEGEKVVLRILESVLQRYSLEELGFTPSDSKIMQAAIERPHGLVLVTGPTGSGKTTTLYTILGILNTPEVNISTVEDPVENHVPRVNQTQINPIIGLTFADGLRALLRQDPNIIMVGEIRDKETGGIAVNSAMTGHLVLSTLHTNDAPGAIPRLIDLGVEPFLLASTLNLIMAQRLVRLICQDCKITYQLSAEVFERLQHMLREEGYSDEDVMKTIPKNPSKSEGCNRCSYTGYHSRAGIYELLVVNENIRTLIVKKSPADEIRKVALAQGMKTMLFDGLSKAAQGQTTIDEVLRVTTE